MAIVFGIATVAAGGRVLAGADPGYTVFQPLVVLNTLMGAAYVLAGLVTWRGLRKGVRAAGAIAAINTLVLAWIGLLRLAGDAVAAESVWAMAFRALAWVGLFAILAWARYRPWRRSPPDGDTA